MRSFYEKTISFIMEIIKTSEDALAVIKKTRLQAPEALETEGYGHLPYECGCGKSHDVNEPKVIKFQKKV